MDSRNGNAEQFKTTPTTAAALISSSDNYVKSADKYADDVADALVKAEDEMNRLAAELQQAKQHAERLGTKLTAAETNVHTLKNELDRAEAVYSSAARLKMTTFAPSERAPLSSPSNTNIRPK